MENLQKIINEIPNDMELGSYIRSNINYYTEYMKVINKYPNDMDLGREIRKNNGDVHQ